MRDHHYPWRCNCSMHYIQGISEKFIAENLSLFTKKWDAKRKHDYMATRNEEIERQRQRDEETKKGQNKRRIKREQEQKEIVERLACLKKGYVMDSDEHLASLLFTVMKESRISPALLLC